jgi:hypothetical protein
MTILKTAQNGKIGNTPFNEKRAICQKSEFSITNRIALENSYWDGERINTHQNWLANQVKAIWKIPQSK